MQSMRQAINSLVTTVTQFRKGIPFALFVIARNNIAVLVHFHVTFCRFQKTSLARRLIIRVFTSKPARRINVDE